MKKVLFLAVAAVAFGASLPDIKEPNGLSFKKIDGYEKWQVAATHWRKDKNELRYVMVDPKSEKAFKKGEKLRDGAIVVKIGWSTKPMDSFPDGIEADKIQRVEYMIKDSKKFASTGGWGYARFVKTVEGSYKPWGGDANECYVCHTAVAGKDYLFSGYQSRF